jgi:hypothetical protein
MTNLRIYKTLSDGRFLLWCCGSLFSVLALARYFPRANNTDGLLGIGCHRVILGALRGSAALFLTAVCGTAEFILGAYCAVPRVVSFEKLETKLRELRYREQHAVLQVLTKLRYRRLTWGVTQQRGALLGSSVCGTAELFLGYYAAARFHSWQHYPYVAAQCSS